MSMRYKSNITKINILNYRLILLLRLIFEVLRGGLEMIKQELIIDDIVVLSLYHAGISLP